MSEIYWVKNRFYCDDQKLDAAHQLTLESELNARRICLEMQNLGFDLEVICLDLLPEKSFPEGLSFYPKGLPITKEGFTLQQQGTGFNICFNLIGYTLAASSLGLPLRIYGGSFCGQLHTLLYKSLVDYFTSENINVYAKCPYFADSQYLKCTVNPAIPCKQCDEAPETFKNQCFEWIELGLD